MSKPRGPGGKGPVCVVVRRSLPTLSIKPAELEGEADYSKAKRTKAEPFVDKRWAVDVVPRVVDSGECRPWAERVLA